jgi:integrase
VDEYVDGNFMARRLGRLTEIQVRRLGPGWHNDGGGLYLRVAGKDQRWWAFRYGAGGARYHGLGPTHTLTLSEAREQARKCRKLLLEGLDPITVGRAARAAVKLTEANTQTFKQCAEAFHAAHCAGWTNQKHAREWLSSLTTHAFPTIGAIPVAAVGTPEVLRVLEPVWATIPETASRLRSRVEAVLDWARVRGYREGENPARWKGHLDHLLPARKKLARVKHHAALPYRDLPAFLPRLSNGCTLEAGANEARALEFVILTAARAGEVVSANWREIVIETGGVWTWAVPAERMKLRRAHRVPLSQAARAVLEQVPADRRRGPIFPGVTVHRLWKLLRTLITDATVHGFRSSFRDWAAEQTSAPREIAEMALAHRVGDDTEEAYRRTDLLEKRRTLMESWGRYCTSPPAPVAADVTPIGDYVHG